jgi:hypothetical protein
LQNLTSIDNLLWIVGFTLMSHCWYIAPGDTEYRPIRSYLLFNMVTVVVLFSISPAHQQTYTVAYWILQAGSIMLQFRILGMFAAEAEIAMWPCLMAMFATSLLPMAHFESHWIAIVISAQRAIFTGRFLVFCMIWMKGITELSETSKKILNAFGVMAGLELVIAWVKTHTGIFGNAALNRIQIASFLVMLVLWISAFRKDQDGSRM